jgi:HSP20 family molecular chaperone IbpA
MANVVVQKIGKDKPAAAPLLKELKDTFEEIRKRAFELFERRGSTPGGELEDWIQAERDLFWIPRAELAETDTEFKINVGVPGMDAKNLEVTAQSGEILVRGNTGKRIEKKEKGVYYSEFGEKSMFRRFEVPDSIDLDRVTASVENGMLTVTAPKKAAQKPMGAAA